MLLLLVCQQRFPPRDVLQGLIVDLFELQPADLHDILISIFYYCESGK